MINEYEDGMGFAGLVPSAAEKVQEKEMARLAEAAAVKLSYTRRIDEVRRDHIVRNAMRLCWKPYRRTVAWAMVSDICGVGSTYAVEICNEIGVDPHKPW